MWGLYGLLAVLLGAAAPYAQAQQKIGYVDSQYILEQMPEYETVQQKLDRLEQQWEQELQKMQEEVDKLFEEYQARELLYTEQERKRKREEIRQKEQELQTFRQNHFGPEGQLYQRQQQLMRPIQEKILAAIDEIARQESYDYVFDKSGDFLFLFAREQHNVSDLVLAELGIDTTSRDNR